ncbi:MAG: fumarylacetoacetate hydrolase family protein [Solirubrobacteraceae bacterium]|nr:fumarylacetoacetate hydrolase family protein [Solirubrobacteraceae bacterium]
MPPTTNLPGPPRPYGLGTFCNDDVPPFAGVVVDGRVVPVAEVLASSDDLSVRGLLERWDDVEPVLQRAVDALPDGRGTELDGFRPLPPIQPPGQLFCAGANYKQHVKQLLMARGVVPTGDVDPAELERQLDAGLDERARSGMPYVFLGLPRSMVGAYDDVVLPEHAHQIDWELELAVIIGAPARNVTRDGALAYVAGYAVSNDVTLRDHVFRPDMPTVGTDWLSGKSAPTLFPIGPWITPARHVDPGELRLTLRLNGEPMQDESTADMVFDVARLIEHVSATCQLLPGDVLLTGSPAGNGAHYGRYLVPGDVMEGEITGLGVIRNVCVAEGAIA